ncbi:2-amino-4-hydroxy-6-hydroxymethyldihydropteridine diphosphokinase [Cryobacterium roopkundense]|uniref:2-amino-4-hydroxy-6-hydroxymethyldihydropteridine diphosphokinase n=1 Tax=Cryobacterium roopkundense TaxID=1001240 RepID=A0A7W9A0E5_9MICO|nr:2-amino-4-hydroxy-6-hydroxymethyldihydropteridine diphosphokinase [Cryobacterium roopkundense]MBB5643574.1 2-amino-4-hydroxy-6-hydroxymethyldihydropteridine diphosphokinase [Cryobacterium roopkundense]
MSVATGAHVVLALGSNLGDRTATLAAAVRDLCAVPGFELEAVSPTFESAAVKLDGVDDAAPRYFNSVVTGNFAGSPHDLLSAVNHIEAQHGRVRTQRWGDRTLDIDIIAVGALHIDDALLTLPHPRAWERDFVLAPWLCIDADAVIPGRGPISDLLAATRNTVMPVADQTGAS